MEGGLVRQKVDQVLFEVGQSFELDSDQTSSLQEILTDAVLQCATGASESAVP
jgi:hypothetical protein